MELTNDEKFKKAIAPKTDQLNADDLLTGPITIKVVKVQVRDSDQQPIDIFYDGDKGKPYRPGKSMGRVLAKCWGGPATWIGKSMTLYRDEKVTWAGMEVGGIRISHLSHIPEKITMALTASKNNRKPYEVKPLAVAPTTAAPTPAPAVSDHDRIAKRIKKAIEDAADADELDTTLRVDYADDLATLARDKPDYHARLLAQYEARKNDLG